MTDARRFFSLVLGFAALCFGAGAGADVHLGGGGDAAARNFAEYCRGELPAARRATFETELARAERALGAAEAADNANADTGIQRLEVAEQALGSAFAVVYRGGGESEMSVKCLGEPTARRWFDAQLKFQRQQTATNPRGGESLYVTAADRGADGLIAKIRDKRPVQFVGAINGLQNLVARFESQREYGAFLLPEEVSIMGACNSAIGTLRKQAAEEHRAALAAEQEAFNRPITEQERAAENAIASSQQIAGALAGIEVDTAEQKETLTTQRRVGESRRLLSEARTWNLERYDDIRTSPASMRARQRGDTLLARAGDTGLSLGARDAFYEDAIAYYDFGGFNDQAAEATAAKQAIQPALQAEQARQEAALDQAAAQMEAKADELREAQKKMQKTEAEKQSFKDEADAMEAELGF